MLLRQENACDHDVDRQLACILAAIAGALNTAAFHAVGFFSANMTGNVSSLSDHAALGQWWVSTFYLAIVVMFVFGGTTSTLLINAGRRRTIRSIYAITILTEATLITVLGLAEWSIPSIERGPVLRSRFCCSSGSFSAITSPPNDNHFEKPLYDPILFVFAVTSCRSSRLPIHSSRNTVRTTLPSSRAAKYSRFLRLSEPSRRSSSGDEMAGRLGRAEIAAHRENGQQVALGGLANLRIASGQRPEVPREMGPVFDVTGDVQRPAPPSTAQMIASGASSWTRCPAPGTLISMPCAIRSASACPCSSGIQASLSPQTIRTGKSGGA